MALSTRYEQGKLPLSGLCSLRMNQWATKGKNNDVDAARQSPNVVPPSYLHTIKAGLRADLSEKIKSSLSFELIRHIPWQKRRASLLRWIAKIAGIRIDCSGDKGWKHPSSTTFFSHGRFDPATFTKEISSQSALIMNLIGHVVWLYGFQPNPI